VVTLGRFREARLAFKTCRIEFTRQSNSRYQDKMKPERTVRKYRYPQGQVASGTFQPTVRRG
jgi:hypothetical protein